MGFNPNIQSRDVFRLKGPAQVPRLQGGILAGMDEPSKPLKHPLDKSKPPKPAPNSPPFPNSNSGILNIKTAQRGKSSKQQRRIKQGNFSG